MPENSWPPSQAPPPGATPLEREREGDGRKVSGLRKKARSCSSTRQALLSLSLSPSLFSLFLTCSMMATLISGCLDSSYAQDRPADPAPTMMTSHSAYSSRSYGGEKRRGEERKGRGEEREKG